MNPQVQQAIDNINQFIVENHNNEITADVLNPILVEIANLWDELVGDLSDSSVDGDTIIEMINQLQQNIEDVTGLTVHTGQPAPNVTPPTTYSAPDLYVRLTPSNIPYEVYIYNGIRWVLIDSGITKISEQWASYVLTGVGGLPILPQINENNRNINITGNPSGLSSLGGFVASGGTSIANFWDGMTARVLNSSPNNQTIKHNYSEADIKYLFPNEEDYTIRPNEVVYFDLRGGNLVFRYSTYLTLEEVRQNGNTVDGVILGSEEFDKQGDRTAFAQIADIEDSVTARNIPESCVVFQFDDSFEGHYDFLFPLFQAKEIVGSLATIYNVLGDAGKMTEEELIEMYEQGWEILVHGNTSLTTLTTEDEVRQEIENNINGIVALGIPSSDLKSYVYPAHHQNGKIRRIAAQYFDSARGQIPTQFVNNDPLYTYELHSYNIDSMAVSDIIDVVDKIKDDHRMVIFYAHETNALFCQDKLEPVIDYIKSEGIDILTTSEAVERFSKGLTSGDGFSSSNRGTRVRLDVGDYIRQGDRKILTTQNDPSTGLPYTTLLGVDSGSRASTEPNTSVGYFATENSSGNKTAVGRYAARTSTGRQTAIGESAGESNTGNQSTQVGFYAGRGNTGIDQTAIGDYAGESNTGSEQTAVGRIAGRLNKQPRQTAVGWWAGYNNNGTNQTAVGADSGGNNVGSNQTAIGTNAGRDNSGNYTVSIGDQSGRGNSGNNSVFIGRNAGRDNTISNRFVLLVDQSSSIPLIDGDFTYGGLAMGAPQISNKLSDSRIGNNRYTLYLDDGNELIHIRFKDNGGNIKDITLPYDGIAQVALSNSYNDLDNLPTIPAQLNPTAGTGVEITGTYPNLTFTNTSPNVVQDLQGVTDAGSNTTNDITVNSPDGSTSISKGRVVITEGISDNQSKLYHNRTEFTDGTNVLTVKTPTLTKNTEIEYQEKDGTVALLSDIPPVIFNQNPLNAVTVTGTTTSTSLLDVSSGTLTLSESDLEVGKTYEFQIYGKYTSNADDFKFRFGLGATYIEVNIPVSVSSTDFPFFIQGNLDIVSVGGNPEAREYYFTIASIAFYEYSIMGNETVDDVTLGNDFTFSVVPTDNSSSFTCTKAILKRLN